MKRFQRLLVIHDPLVDNRSLWQWCRQLNAVSQPERIDVLAPVDWPLPEYSGADEQEVSPPSADQELSEAIASEAEGLPIELHFSRGEGLREALQLLRGGEFDLVLTTLQDERSRIFAERLTRKSPAGVLAVPNGASFPPLSIAAAVDFSDLSPLTIEWAQAFSTLSPENQGRKTVLHFVRVPTTRLSASHGTDVLEPGYLESGQRHLTTFMEELPQNDTRWEHTVDSSLFPGGSMASYANNQDCDLLILGSHGSNALSLALLGSNTADVLRRSQKPVLVVKRKNESLAFLLQLLGMRN
ncbi:MAG: universal stress protein [Verrucomicrobiota bacterium]